MSFIAGPYTITWGGVTLGQAERGIDFEEPGWGEGEPITGDDFGHECIQDYALGNGNAYASFVLNEYNAAAVRSLLSPSGTSGRLFQAGILATSLAAAMVFTRVSSSTTATPTTRTANKAILAPGQNVRYLMSTKHRKVPIRIQFLPYLVSTGIYAHWVDS